jgi:hypothetical protein
MTSFSRTFAALSVSIVFAIITIITVMIILNIGTQITHGNMVEHQHGVILSKSNADNSLTFKTDSGQTMHFSCMQHCLVQLGHIQRHIQERAGTDVYYKQEDDQLIAVDVD